MKQLQLDFSQYQARLRNTVGGAALVACLLGGFALLASQRSLNQQIAQYDVQHEGVAVSRTAHDPLMLAEEKQAREAERALNMPWNPLFGALEQVQTVSSGIHLLSIQPNPVKGEVVLGGEAENFSILMDYVKALRAQPQFPDVGLVNQRLADPAASESRLAFTLQAQWKP